MKSWSRGVEQCGLGIVSGPGGDLNWLDSDLQPSQNTGGSSRLQRIIQVGLLISQAFPDIFNPASATP